MKKKENNTPSEQIQNISRNRRTRGNIFIYLEFVELEQLRSDIFPVRMTQEYKIIKLLWCFVCMFMILIQKILEQKKLGVLREIYHWGYQCLSSRSTIIQLYPAVVLFEQSNCIKIVSSNPAHGEVYSIQHYWIKIVSNLRQIDGFLPVLFISSSNKTDCHDITEILLKVALTTITLTPIPHHISKGEKVRD